MWYSKVDCNCHMMMLTGLSVMGLPNGLPPAGLVVDMYSDCAMHGTPQHSMVNSLDNFTLNNFGGSAEISGTLTFGAGLYAFDCSFGGGQLVFVWVDDHLICHTDPPFSNNPSSTDGTPQNPLRGTPKSAEGLPLVIHIYSYDAGNTYSKSTASVSVRWAQIPVPVAVGTVPKWEPIPTSALAPVTPPLELQRRELQRSLASGWAPWDYNMLDIVRLPQSFALTTALCQISTQSCLLNTHIEDTRAHIRVGPFSTDQCIGWDSNPRSISRNACPV